LKDLKEIFINKKIGKIVESLRKYVYLRPLVAK